MTINEIQAKSILRKHKKIDSRFITRYGMNLYRGCTHNCVYCDGRAEGYYVPGEFGEDVAVKVNAIDILRRELDPKRKRKPFKPGFIAIGGGVGDSYQPVEKKYRLSRKTLELIYEHGFPVHVLTKSTLIERDIDLLKKINETNRVLVSFSFSSVDEKISTLFEPGVPAPEKRFATLALLKKEGIACGMFLLPVIPFVTDTPQLIAAALAKAREIGLDYLIFGGMTLKEGRQKDYFMNVLKKHYPRVVGTYAQIYRGDRWGAASGEYYDSINQVFHILAGKFKIPVRIPPRLYRDILDKNDLVVVLLEHIDYLLKLQGQKSPYGYAAYSISKLKEPLAEMAGELAKIKGVGRVTHNVIREILETGRSSYYEKLSSASGGPSGSRFL